MEKYEDLRAGPYNVEKSIPDTLKGKIKREVTMALEEGFPVTSKWIRDILIEEGINCHKTTLCRTLKRWGIPYGTLKTAANNKEKEYVKNNFWGIC